MLHPLLAALTITALVLVVRQIGRVLRNRYAELVEPSALEAIHCPRDMKPVAGGAFELGDEVEVELDSFCLDEKEVTVGAYAKCVAAGKCSVPVAPEGRCNWGNPERAQHPINCVDWFQAERYCRFMGKALPSEAQWEYAARGGFRELEYPWGTDWPDHTNACWSPMSNKDATCRVGDFPATSFGLRDMAGNVSEWVIDRHAPYPARPARNHVNPGVGELHVGRGGSFTVGDPMLLHSVIREERPPDIHIEQMGMRCARAPLQ